MDLKTALYIFAGIGEQEYLLGENFFVHKSYKKGESMSVQDYMGSDLAFIIKGLIRVYYIDSHSGKEINLFFYQENQFLFSFLLLSEGSKGNYILETLEDCEVYKISRENLEYLYKTSHKWEHFGRLLAEEYYRGSNKRTESFIFKTPEERYLDLLETNPTIFQRTSLHNISSYVGIERQSLSRIRNRLIKKKV